jgi:histidinol phosphatase-like PHP family hydrolase
MSFGLFDSGKIAPGNPLRDNHGYKDFFEYIREADRLGLESMSVVEHASTTVGQLSADATRRRAAAAA